MQSYWWIRFRTWGAKAELDQDRLFELGASGLEELVNSLEPQTDEGMVLKAFFEDEAAFQGAIRHFDTEPEFEAGEAPVEDWDRSWRDRQTPVDVSPGLVVVPPWVDPPPPGKQVIRLEAKMAFGTGSHESTMIAACLLEHLSPKGKTVLDIGTGTGILALYAGLLGARSVLALDIDKVVGPCLRENLNLNPMPPGCRFNPFIGITDALEPGARFDLIICNMIRTELWPFREELRQRLEPGGHFVVSGQRLEDKSHFEAWRRGSPFSFAEEMEMGSWWGFTGTV